MTTPPNHNTADQSGADEREEFEAWCANNPNWNPDLTGSPDYHYEAAGIAWDAWQYRASTQPAPQPMSSTSDFKNFHRLLCSRFDYCHDEQYWWRDQLSLIEHIANPKNAEPIAWYIEDADVERMYNGHNDFPRGLKGKPLYATPQPFPAPAVQSGDTHYSEDDLANELATIRDLFPIPDKGSPLEQEWGAAMGDPMSVSGYVADCLAAPSQTVAGKELRALGWELEGVIQDVESGNYTCDFTCMETIRRVRDALLTTANAGKDATPTYTTGHCEHNNQPGGCQQHNLHCGWPKCDQKEINHA